MMLRQCRQATRDGQHLFVFAPIFARQVRLDLNVNHVVAKAAILLFCVTSLSSFAGCQPVHQANSAGVQAPNDSNVQHAKSSESLSEEGAVDLRILFIGNSHTMNNDIPSIVKRLFESAPEKVFVATETIGTAFLEDLEDNQRAQLKITSGNWNVVVLQGQKISMSGKYLYSTGTAKKLSRMAHASGARVVLYSEWGREGNSEEASRTKSVYEEIRAANNDLLAPVGTVWDEVLERRPDLRLHASDGNHANSTGAFLTALTLYSVISARDCRLLRHSTDRQVDKELFELFTDVVDQVVDGPRSLGE